MTMRLKVFLFSSFSYAVVLAANPRTYENTAVVRSIDLGGALTYVSTTYAIRAVGQGQTPYYFALSDDEEKTTTWMDVRIKGRANTLPVDKHGFNVRSHTFQYAVDLPTLPENGTTTLVINTIQSHAATPFPATAKQGDPQNLFYSTGVYILSPYNTLVQRLKLRTPTTNILSHTLGDRLHNYLAKDTTEAVSKGTSTITYGPFQNVPASATLQFQKQEQSPVNIHYEYDKPVLTVVQLKRAAEVSHWGANLNIQDEIILRNDGPALKGHFSRLDHQHQAYYKKHASQSVRAITLNLPAGVTNPYFYDIIGNVSTSRFRPASLPKNAVRPALKGAAGERFSLLELRPRYPLLGGWNYTFTLGWDAPLGHSAGWDEKQGAYVLAVPFMTHIPGTAVDEAEVKVILPEGAEVVSVHEPFKVESTTHSRHITFLDTIGRPEITFRARGLTDKHDGVIYIVYKLSLRAHLLKPVAVGGVTFSLFLLGMLIKRIDTRIAGSPVADSKKKQ